MKYCSNCILPNTRPEVEIYSDGICSQCKSHLKKKKINWSNRLKKLEKIFENIKKQKNFYDCLIPVSGGKDSTWQVLICKKYKLNPLTFSYKPILRTRVGQKNLNNMISLGVNHIDFTINENIEKYFIKKSFIKFGAVGLPMHMAMWGISSQLANFYKIPLIVWGENSASHYSGTKKNLNLKNLDERWIKSFGINFGTKPKDWYDKTLNFKNMSPYVRIKNKLTKSIFLGDYIKWDPQKIYLIAKKNGFLKDKKGAKTGFFNFADIDDDLISIHHYLKLYKFGFTRMHDNLSIEIRNNRISRAKAVSIVKKEFFKKPSKDIKKFCRLINMKQKKFFEVCEKFRNKEIWIKKDKTWKLKFPLE